MATSFPTSIDNGTNLPDPVPTDTLATVPHSTLHKNVNDAIKALETKVGISTITTVTPVVTTTPLALATNYQAQFTPNANVTLTSTVPAIGIETTLIVLTSGVTSYTLTFGTGFKSQGTLATGTVTAKYFVLKFISNGTNLLEISRTLAM